MLKRTEVIRVRKILAEAKKLAVEYKTITGRPLGIAGEVAEHEAARLLKLILAPARESGFDAHRLVRGRRQRLQIKCRVVTNRKSQKMGAISAKKPWDAILLVVMDGDFDVTDIWEASRAKVIRLLGKTDSKARRRGQLTVSEFKRSGQKVWPAKGLARAVKQTLAARRDA